MDRRGIPQRKSPRLSGWDYSATAWYFITVCTKSHIHYFGEVLDSRMQLNELGRMAQECWLQIPHHFIDISLDEFIIMPNHVHGIGSLEDSAPALGSVMGNFKAAVTRWAKTNGLGSFGWQPRYYDHIVRNEQALYGIRQYIHNNPIKWELEKGHPENVSFEEVYRL